MDRRKLILGSIASSAVVSGPALAKVSNIQSGIKVRVVAGKWPSHRVRQVFLNGSGLCGSCAVLMADEANGVVVYYPSKKVEDVAKLDIEGGRAVPVWAYGDVAIDFGDEDAEHRKEYRDGIDNDLFWVVPT